MNVHSAVAAMAAAAADPDAAAAAAGSHAAAAGAAAAPGQHLLGKQGGWSGWRELPLSPVSSGPASPGPDSAVPPPPTATSKDAWSGFLHFKAIGGSSGGASSTAAGSVSGIAMDGHWWQPGGDIAVGPASVPQGSRQAMHLGGVLG